jgi:hypothetical protein
MREKRKENKKASYAKTGVITGSKKGTKGKIGKRAYIN